MNGYDRQSVKVENYENRAFKKHPSGGEPYSSEDGLSQKLWSVVEREFGPNVADVLVKKLHQAVIDHVAHGSR